MRLPLASLLPIAQLLISCDNPPAAMHLSGATKIAPCLGIEIPVETEASVAGVYEGPTPQGEPTRKPGERLVRTVTLTGEKLALPQILILSSYEPVNWDLSALPPGIVRGVVTYAYEPGSRVSGAQQNTVVKQVWLSEGSTSNGSDTGCGTGHYVYKGGPELDALVEDVERTTRTIARRFVGAYNPATLDLDGGSDQGTPEEEPFAGRGDIYPGIERLKLLVERGDVRPARKDDVAAWNAAATAQLKTGNLANFRHEDLFTGNTYVVLKSFEMIDGMTGANSRNFIVPGGIEPPLDHGSHNTYFLMDGGRCTGGDPTCALLESAKRPGDR